MFLESLSVFEGRAGVDCGAVDADEMPEGAMDENSLMQRRGLDGKVLIAVRGAASRGERE